jgi:hypothetical protein
METTQRVFDEWMDKPNTVHMYISWNVYSILKSNEVLAHAATWMHIVWF